VLAPRPLHACDRLHIKITMTVSQSLSGSTRGKALYIPISLVTYSPRPATTASAGSQYTAMHYGETVMLAGLGPSETVGSITCASVTSQKHVPL
jgi:hypothetical protein